MSAELMDPSWILIINSLVLAFRASSDMNDIIIHDHVYVVILGFNHAVPITFYIALKNFPIIIYINNKIFTSN